MLLDATEATDLPVRKRLELRAVGISKRYGRRFLFRDLSLVLHGGQSVAITGPNGSGKSTLLRILGGLLTPSTGAVELSVDAKRIPLSDHPLHVGIVAPYVNLYEHLSAAENLNFVLRLRGQPGPQDRVGPLLDEVGLGEKAHDIVSTYSSGMMQRLRLAAAIVSEPDVLLLDEPTSTLDAEGTVLVRRLVGRSTSEGRIVIVATNLETEAAMCATECAVPRFLK